MITMPSHPSQILWRILRARRVDFLIPLVLNIVVAAILAFALHAAISANWSITLTTLSAAACFFIVFGIHHVILRLLYSGSLVTYMAKTRERHAVTMTFGAEILRRFLTEGFTADFVRDIDSLPWMLQRLEDGDHPLSLVSYAMLLDKAAEMKPDQLWAVWNFAVVPIDAVFDISGQPQPNYVTYLQTLKRIYLRIPSADDKSRLFIFDDADARATTESHPGWTTLKKFMKEWGLTEYRVTTSDVFDGIKRVWPGVTMDDFVIFKKLGFMSQEWVIGMKLGTHGVGLRHDTVIEDFERLWRSVSADCERISL